MQERYNSRMVIYRGEGSNDFTGVVNTLTGRMNCSLGVNKGVGAGKIEGRHSK